MNIKKIMALVSAVCLIGGACTAPYIGISAPSAACAADDSANSVTLQKIGDKYTLKLGGTTETPRWYSDDESVATIESTGGLSAEVTAVGKGTTTVYAELSGQLLRFSVTVLGIEEDEMQVVEVGSFTLTNVQPTATAALTGVDSREAVWASSDEKVAAVDENGEITAVGKGKCVITAVYNNVKYIMNVTSEYDPEQAPTEAGMPCAGSVTLSDEASSKKINMTLPEDASVIFTSSDESVATVSQQGVITAKGEGTCKIYIDINGRKSYIDVTSTYTGKTDAEGPIKAGHLDLTAETPSRKLTLTNLPADTKVEWSSSDESVAVVKSGGNVFAKGSGECTLTGKAGGKEYLVTVKVDLSDFEKQLTATEIEGAGKSLTLQNTGKNPKFTSSDEKVVTVDEKGNIKSVGAGTAIVTIESDTSVTFLAFRVLAKGKPGDANCDGSVTVADATLILQCIGNGDKYKLSEEGKLNGDVDGSKGISAVDALTIQMFEAGVINSLPVQPKS